MKRYKVAISVAIFAAVAVPALIGTWRLAPSRWQELTTTQKRRLENYMVQTNYCANVDNSFDKIACGIEREQLANGGVLYPAERITPKYLIANVIASAGSFAFAFTVMMILPTLGGRYWRWLWK